MKDRLIATVPRNIILNSSVRYGVSRNVPAEDGHGKPVKICLVIIERDNGSFETVGINEERIRFQGEGIIEEEVLRKVYA
jgi:hypothetical protein